MKRLLAGLLLAAGILITGASGLCSTAYVGWVAMAFLFDKPGLNSVGGDAAGMFFALMTLLIFGGIPFVCGLGLIKAGRWLQRDARAVDSGEFE